jgi:hypothetical protein
MNTLTIRFGKVSFYDNPSKNEVIVTVSDDHADGFFTFASVKEAIEELPDAITIGMKVVELPQFEHLEFKTLPGGDAQLANGTLKIQGYSEMKRSASAKVLPLNPNS